MFRSRRRGITDKSRIRPFNPQAMPVVGLSQDNFGPSAEHKLDMLKKRLINEEIRRRNMGNQLIQPQQQTQMPTPVTWGGMGHGSAQQQPLYKNQDGTSLSRTDTLLDAPMRRV